MSLSEGPQSSLAHRMFRSLESLLKVLFGLPLQLLQGGDCCFALAPSAADFSLAVQHPGVVSQHCPISRKNCNFRSKFRQNSLESL